MNAPKSDVVMICVSHGFHVRNILYSKLYEQLIRTMRVILIVPTDVFIPEEDQYLLRGATLISVPIVSHKFESIFMFLRKNVFAGRERTQTFNLISEIERNKHPWLYPIASACNAVLGRFPVFGRAWQKIEAQFIRGREFDKHFDVLRPKIVVTANYGTLPFEVRLLRSAHRHRVATLALIPSFDNLSSKGVIGENPKHIVVWNRIMHDEARSLYGFTEDAIHICGGLQFDIYADAPSLEEEDQILRQLGLDPSRPFVVIGTITPRYFANNVDIVDIINQAVSDGRLPADLQIVVRLHPQVVDDPHFGDNLDQYRDRAVASSRIKLSIPRIMRWGAITPPTPGDGTELMTLLRRSAVSVMPASTLALDACALGAPVVGIGFDGYEFKPYDKSVRRMFDFTHYKRIINQSGMRIVESQEQLLLQITEYLGNRARDQEGRARILSTHLGTIDGTSWQQVLGVVTRLIG